VRIKPSSEIIKPEPNELALRCDLGISLKKRLKNSSKGLPPPGVLGPGKDGEREATVFAVLILTTAGLSRSARETKSVGWALAGTIQQQIKAKVKNNTSTGRNLLITSSIETMEIVPTGKRSRHNYR
jgi:hypothetical protein